MGAESVFVKFTINRIPMNTAQKLGNMPTSTYLDEDTYLQREIEALEKTEYIAGILYPRWQMIAGKFLMHNALCVNVLCQLHGNLARSKYRALTSDMRIYNPRTPAYLYPDALVLGDTPELPKHDSLSNPLLLLEVNSPQSVDYDRTTKLIIYDTMPSVQEYIIISQMAREIMLFRRNNHGVLAFAEIATERVVLQSIGCLLNIDEVYVDTDFDEEFEQKNTTE
jgi:Uma2 family endonuclease